MKKIIVALIIFLTILIILYFNYPFDPGLNVLVINNTDRYISALEFRGASDSVESLLIGDIQPYSTAKGCQQFNYISETAMFYKNDGLMVVQIPVMYILNHLDVNVLIVTINSIDEHGNITDYKLENSVDNSIFFKSLLLAIQQ